MIGDGYCNDETNTQQCNFDGGDCCGSCIISDFCTNCSCIGGITGNCQDYDLACPLWVNSGYCQHTYVDYMNENCGESCGTCLGNVIGNGVPNVLVGNGYCNDDTNTQQCNFDGGDCCLLNVNTDYCSNCSCSGSGVITSPRFPDNYDNNLDLTWLIQLPLGQWIEIIFFGFELEDHSNLW